MVHAACCTPRAPVMQQFAEFNPLDVLAAAASLQSAHDADAKTVTAMARPLPPTTQDHSYAFLYRDVRARADTEDDGYCSRSSLDSPGQWSRSDSDAYEQDVFDTADLLSPVSRRPVVASPPCWISPRGGGGGGKVTRNTAVLRSLLVPHETELVRSDEHSSSAGNAFEKRETDASLNNVWFTIAEPKRRSCLDACERTTPVSTDAESLQPEDSPQDKEEEMQADLDHDVTTVSCSDVFEMQDNDETVDSVGSLLEQGNKCCSPLSNCVEISNERCDPVESTSSSSVSCDINNIATEPTEESITPELSSGITGNCVGNLDDAADADDNSSEIPSKTRQSGDTDCQNGTDVDLVAESAMPLSQQASETVSDTAATTQQAVQENTDSSKHVKVVCVNNNVVDSSKLFILNEADLDVDVGKVANEDKTTMCAPTLSATKYPYIIEDDVSPVTKYGNVLHDVKNEADTVLGTKSTVSLKNVPSNGNNLTVTACGEDETITSSPGFVTDDTCGDVSSCDEDVEMSCESSQSSLPIVTPRSLTSGSAWVTPVSDVCAGLQKSPLGEQINVKIAGGRLVDITRDGSPTSLKGWTPCAPRAVTPVTSLGRKRSSGGAFIPITGAAVSLPLVPRGSPLLHPLIDHDYCAFSEFSADIQSSIIATTESKLRTEKKYTKKTKAARTTKTAVVPVVQPEAPVVTAPIAVPVVKKRKYIRRKVSVRGAKKKAKMAASMQNADIQQPTVVTAELELKRERALKRKLAKAQFLAASAKRRSDRNFVKITGSYQNDFVYFATKKTRGRQTSVAPTSTTVGNPLVVGSSLQPKLPPVGGVSVFDWYRDLSHADKSSRFGIAEDPGSDLVEKQPTVVNSTPQTMKESDVVDLVMEMTSVNSNSSFVNKSNGFSPQTFATSKPAEEPVNEGSMDLNVMAEEVRTFLNSMDEDELNLLERLGDAGGGGGQKIDVPYAQPSSNLLDLDDINDNDLLPADYSNINVILGDLTPSHQDKTDLDDRSAVADSIRTASSTDSMSSIASADYVAAAAELSNNRVTASSDAVTSSPLLASPVSTAPDLTVVSMFWNDLPGLLIGGEQYVRLVDIHKQILPAKDTGILKKRCQMMGLQVLACTELQRDFLVRYANAAKSKSTVIVSRDTAQLLIGFYVNPRPRNPRQPAVDRMGGSDEPRLPATDVLEASGKASDSSLSPGATDCKKTPKATKRQLSCVGTTPSGGGRGGRRKRRCVGRKGAGHTVVEDATNRCDDQPNDDGHEEAMSSLDTKENSSLAESSPILDKSGVDGTQEDLVQGDCSTAADNNVTKVHNTSADNNVSSTDDSKVLDEPTVSEDGVVDTDVECEIKTAPVSDTIVSTGDKICEDSDHKLTCENTETAAVITDNAVSAGDVLKRSARLKHKKVAYAVMAHGQEEEDDECNDVTSCEDAKENKRCRVSRCKPSRSVSRTEIRKRNRLEKSRRRVRCRKVATGDVPETIRVQAGCERAQLCVSEYVTADAACVQCTACNERMSVRAFLQHSHSGAAPPPSQTTTLALCETPSPTAAEVDAWCTFVLARNRLEPVVVATPESSPRHSTRVRRHKHLHAIEGYQLPDVVPGDLPGGPAAKTPAVDVIEPKQRCRVRRTKNHGDRL